MGIEGGSNSEVQNQEINQANNEQNEINQAEHQRSGEELEGNSTIDNEGERKQIEGKDDANYTPIKIYGGDLKAIDYHMNHHS